jgi:hypothetical protein
VFQGGTLRVFRKWNAPGLAGRARWLRSSTRAWVSAACADFGASVVVVDLVSALLLCLDGVGGCL